MTNNHHAPLPSLFHHFALLQDGQPVHDFRATKAQALLAYLAIEANQAHLRKLRWQRCCGPMPGETVANRNFAPGDSTACARRWAIPPTTVFCSAPVGTAQVGDQRCPLEVDVALSCPCAAR